MHRGAAAVPGQFRNLALGHRDTSICVVILVFLAIWRPAVSLFLLVLLAVVGPLPLLPTQVWGLALPLTIALWLGAGWLQNLAVSEEVFQNGWKYFVEGHDPWKPSIFGTAAIHGLFTLTFCSRAFIVERMSHLLPYKVSGRKACVPARRWLRVLGFNLASQVLIQIPLLALQHAILRSIGTSFAYEEIPGVLSMLWRLAVALVLYDFWSYFLHSVSHSRTFRRFHKFHHDEPVIFAALAEYHHPVETVVNFVGSLIPIFLANHYAWILAWMFVRLWLNYEAYLGYDLPFNLLRVLPFYRGTREQSWHHEYQNGMYAPVLSLWDRLLGTSHHFEQHDRKRRINDALLFGEAAEKRGDEWYASRGENRGAPAGTLAKEIQQVPFSTCLVTGVGGMLGQRIVPMLASRGAKRILCLDKVPMSEAFKELAARCRGEHGTEIVYVQRDITSMASLLSPEGLSGVRSAFDGVEAVFHIAALVGPYHKTETYRAVNGQGTKNTMEALIQHGCKSRSNLVFVDCSSTSTRYPKRGNVNGLMEVELSYTTGIHEYASSKAAGEQAVLRANGRQVEEGTALATCAVLPNDIYAPEDTLFIPTLVDSAKNCILYAFGSGEFFNSYTHADNIAHAMIIAGGKLFSEGASSVIAGDFFVITDGVISSLWDTVNDIIVELGYTTLFRKIRIDVSILYIFAYICEAAGWITGRVFKLSPFAVRMMSINRTFCSAKARHILGYAPVVSSEDGWKDAISRFKKRSQFDGNKHRVGKSNDVEMGKVVGCQEEQKLLEVDVVNKKENH